MCLDFWEKGEEDPEKLWELFTVIITEVADIHCPFKKMKFRDDSPEWITREMVQEIAHKDNLYKRAKHTHDHGDWNLFHNKKNEVKQEMWLSPLKKNGFPTVLSIGTYGSFSLAHTCTHTCMHTHSRP